MRLIVEHVRRFGGDDAVRKLLAEAGEDRPLAVVEDERVWSSYAAKIRLFEAAATVTGQPDVARRIGRGALDSGVGGTIRLLLGLVGSPAQVLRGIARAHSKFSTAAEIAALSVDATSALVRYRVLQPHEPSAHDCAYTAGLLSQIPVLFGLPAATVRHDVCQVRGGEACLYALSWERRRRRLPFSGAAVRGTPADAPAAVVLQRLQDLQETVAELVADRSVDEVLQVVTGRARSTVGAQRFLLVTRLDDGAAPRIHSDGFTAEEAETTATRLLADQAPETGEHVIVAPLRSSSHDYGRLAAFGRSPFFDHEEGLLASYASLAATALDAVTALDEARERTQVSEALLGFARALLATRDRHEVAHATAEAALSVAFSDAASVMLYDPVEEVLKLAGHAGWSESAVQQMGNLEIRTADTPELASLLVQPEAPRLYDRTTTDPMIRWALETGGRSCILVLPLWSASRLWGIVITAWDAPLPGVTDRLLERLSGLAGQAITAFDRAELAEQVQRQATVDSLTGALNRKAFTDRLHQVLRAGSATELAKTAGRPGLIFLDVDGLKPVNDTLGHAAGDELLCAVAQRLGDLVRTDDLVARLGGDEFTVLLSAVTGNEELERIASEIRVALSQPVLVDGRELRITSSVGAVLVSPAYRSVRELLRDADAAMYAAKKAGGDRSVVFDPGPGVATG
jgi:diguanylate cyclase (GGDEF)-like protein